MHSYFITHPDKELAWCNDCNYNTITTNIDRIKLPTQGELLFDPPLRNLQTAIRREDEYKAYTPIITHIR